MCGSQSLEPSTCLGGPNGQERTPVQFVRLDWIESDEAVEALAKAEFYRRAKPENIMWNELPGEWARNEWRNEARACLRAVAGRAGKENDEQT